MNWIVSCDDVTIKRLDSIISSGQNENQYWWKEFFSIPSYLKILRIFSEGNYGLEGFEYYQQNARLLPLNPKNHTLLVTRTYTVIGHGNEKLRVLKRAWISRQADAWLSKTYLKAFCVWKYLWLLKKEVELDRRSEAGPQSKSQSS